MKRENVVQEKAFAFAVKVVRTYQTLIENNKEFVLSRQLLRSGTSIGANIEEAIGSHSGKDFLFKIGISYKEARETIYWVKLLKEVDYLSAPDAISLIEDAEELCRIISAIQITMKSKIRNPK